jgi:hypothetical protein
MQQQEIVERYRRMRKISNRHHNAALDFLTRPAMIEPAKRLGLASGNTLILDSDEEMALVCDLAVHTAKPGRSRAIDRYARAMAFAPGSEEDLVLEAIRVAQFSVWSVVRRHDVAGLIVADAMSQEETWLMDEHMTRSLSPGYMFAARLSRPAAFAMTCGVIVPIDPETFHDELHDNDAALRLARRAQSVGDAAFAATVYRIAIDSGMMETIRFENPTYAS